MSVSPFDFDYYRNKYCGRCVKDSFIYEGYTVEVLRIPDLCRNYYNILNPDSSIVVLHMEAVSDDHIRDYIDYNIGG